MSQKTQNDGGCEWESPSATRWHFERAATRNAYGLREFVGRDRMGQLSSTANLHDLDLVKAVSRLIESGALVGVYLEVSGGAKTKAIDGATLQRQLVSDIERATRGKLLNGGRTYKLTADVDLGDLPDRDRYEVVGQRDAGRILDELAHQPCTSPELAGLLAQVREKLTHDWRPPLQPERPDPAPPGGNGASLYSNHKHGLAVDLCCHIQDKGPGANAIVLKAFPVVYEGNWYYQGNKAMKAANQAVTDATAANKKANTNLERVKKLLGGVAFTDKAKARLAEAEEGVTNTERELKKKKEALEGLEKKGEPSKAGQTLRWRLYGHCTLDAFGLAAPGLHKALADRLGVTDKGDWGIVTEYRKLLRGKFPAGASQDSIDEVIKEGAERLATAAATLMKAAQPPAKADAKAEIVDGYFRQEVAQFEYKPWEPDGGRPGACRKAPEDAAHWGLTGIHCWLNLTRLGHQLGMWRITAHRSEFKREYDNPDADTGKKIHPVSITNLVVLPHKDFKGRKVTDDLGNLADQIEAVRKNMPDFMIPVRTGGKGKRIETKVSPSDFDLTMMRAWPVVVKDKIPKGVSFDGMDIVVTMSAEKGARDKALDFVKSAFGGVQLKIVEVGALLDIPFTKNDSAKGEASSSQVKDAKNPFKKSPDPKSQAKSPQDWSVLLRAPLLKDGTSLWQAMVQLPNPGIPRALEWWHYDCYARAGKTWVSAAGELGYSVDVLTAPEEASETAGAIMSRGCGLDASRGAVGVPREPENHAVPPKEE